MAVIEASISIVRIYVRAVQNVMAPLVGFHDSCPDDDNERDKQKRFDDHVFNTSPYDSLGDRPATVVNKIRAST